MTRKQMKELEDNVVFEDMTVYQLKPNKSMKKEIPSHQRKVSSPMKLHDLFVNHIYDESIEIHETTYLLFLSRNLSIKGIMCVSQGGMTGTVVDVRLVCKSALDSLASSVAIVHNHPGGSTKPSDADLKITQKVKDALSLFDIEVLDHIIVTPNDGYFSMREEGLL